MEGLPFLEDALLSVPIPLIRGWEEGLSVAPPPPSIPEVMQPAGGSEPKDPAKLLAPWPLWLQPGPPAPCQAIRKVPSSAPGVTGPRKGSVRLGLEVGCL